MSTELTTTYHKHKQSLRKEIAEIINAVVTPELVLDHLRELQPPAPSGTVLYTRTPTIRRILFEAGLPPEEFSPRFLGTRSPAVFLRPGCGKDIWISAHSDQPTYLLKTRTKGTTFELMPNCAHRPKKLADGTYPSHPGAVVHFDPKSRIYTIINTGTIYTRDDLIPYYTTETPPEQELSPGYDRIVYASPLTFDQETGIITGNTDNAAGVAASLAAIQAILEIVKQYTSFINRISGQITDTGFVFPDEEEGLPEASAYFAREARRIIHRTGGTIRTPLVVVNNDGHDTSDVPSAALYGVYVSGGKGPVLPPDVYAVYDDFFQELKDCGVILYRTEEILGASLSRSNDAADMEKTLSVAVGYGTRNPHNNKEAASVNLYGLVNTAKALAWIAFAGQKLSSGL